MASRQTSEPGPEGAEFAVKRPPTIAVDDLERLLDRRFAVLATAEQINKMSDRISRNEEEIGDIKTEIRQINRKLDNGSDTSGRPHPTAAPMTTDPQ